MPRLRCFLRELRGPVTLREIAEQAGMNPGDISRIEAGLQVPRDDQIPRLEAAYGAPVTDWYPPMVLLALEFDDSALLGLRARLHEAWRRS